MRVRPDQELLRGSEGQHVLSTAMIPPAAAEVPPPPPPPGGSPSTCSIDNRCSMTPRCRHYGACRIADVLFERTKGRRL